MTNLSAATEAVISQMLRLFKASSFLEKAMLDTVLHLYLVWGYAENWKHLQAGVLGRAVDLMWVTITYMWHNSWLRHWTWAAKRCLNKTQIMATQQWLSSAGRESSMSPYNWTLHVISKGLEIIPTYCKIGIFPLNLSIHLSACPSIQTTDQHQTGLFS